MSETPAVHPPAARPSARSLAGQVLLYALFATVIGVFSHWPTYRHLQDSQAVLKVSFTHTAKPLGECRAQNEAELAKLPPNMRAPTVCPRERSPVRFSLDIDGANVLTRSAPPSGLSHDGASAMYQRMVLPAGEHRLVVRLNDDARSEGFGYEREATIRLAPAQVLVIDFDATKGGITLQ